MYQSTWFHPDPFADAVGGEVILHPSAKDFADRYHRFRLTTFDPSLEPGTAIVGGLRLAGVTFVTETDVGGHPIGPAAYGFDREARLVYFNV